MKAKIKIEPRVATKVQQKMMLIYVGAGFALVTVIAVFLFFYLNIGNQQESYANNKTYKSSGSGDWNSASTWAKGNIPPLSGLNKDEVIIDHDINYDGAFTVNNQVSLTINEGASLVLAENFLINNDLTLIVNGELIINGSVVANNGAKISVNGGGIMNVTQNAVFKNNTVFTVDGKLVIGGDLTFGNNASFAGSGNVTLGLSGCSAWNGTSGNCVESDNEVLPITLLSFSVKRDNDDVIIRWQTAAELDNDYFEIERSSDGREFKQIARINGNGTSTVTLDYEYVDTTPFKGVSYYRLSQTDFDGTTEVFDIYLVQATSFTSNNVTIFPNPLYGSTLHMVIDQPEAGSIEIMDQSGHKIFSQVIGGNEREYEMTLPDNMNTGIYFVHITTASIKKSFKLAKK